MSSRKKIDVTLQKEFQNRVQAHLSYDGNALKKLCAVKTH